MKAIAWITLAIAPVLILLVFQFKFLPYHSHFVTWTLRILIVIDLAVALILWPAVRNPARDVTLRMIVRQWFALPIAIAVAGFAWIILNFPGEPHAEWARYWEDGEQERAEVECRTMSPISIIVRTFDRLNLSRVDVVDDEKLEKIKEHTKAVGEADFQGERTRPLRGRDFNCADFSNYADLRRVDFTEASLRGASFVLSKLQGASLNRAQLQGADLSGAELQGAFLVGAQLQGASLTKAQLQGADLSWAQLQGAFLVGAELQGADLSWAQLQGASLGGDELQGASLTKAKRQGGFPRAHRASLNGPSFRAHSSLGPSFRAHSSLRPSFRAQTFFWPSFRAQTFLGPSFRAHS